MSSQFAKLPSLGVWQLKGAYEGHEVVHFDVGDDEVVLEGITVGVEEGVPWSIHYIINLTADWHVTSASVEDYAGRRLAIKTNGKGSWVVNEEYCPELEGCLDLDFEASAVTNTIPVHRLDLEVEQQGESVAVYIRTNGLAIERLDQTYRRLPSAKDKILFDYKSPRFGYHDTLQFGLEGLAGKYPGIAERLPSKA